MNNINQPQIDLSATTPVVSEGGNQIWTQGFIIRKVSKFVAGTKEDAVMPIPVFYDKETGEVLLDTLPPELRKEFGGEDPTPSPLKVVK